MFMFLVFMTSRKEETEDVFEEEKKQQSANASKPLMQHMHYERKHLMSLLSALLLLVIRSEATEL